MSVQTTITNEPAIGTPGLVYDTSAPHDIQTYIAQEDIPFGAYVRISGQYCELPDNSGEVTGKGGVAVRDTMHATTVGYKSGEPVAVMTFGRIWVATEQAIADQAAPFVRFASGGGGTQQGAWRNDADTATAVQPSTTAVHMYRGVAGAGLAVVELGRTGA